MLNGPPLFTPFPSSLVSCPASQLGPLNQCALIFSGRERNGPHAEKVSGSHALPVCRPTIAVTANEQTHRGHLAGRASGSLFQTDAGCVRPKVFRVDEAGIPEIPVHGPAEAVLQPVPGNSCAHQMIFRPQRVEDLATQRQPAPLRRELSRARWRENPVGRLPFPYKETDSVRSKYFWRRDRRQRWQGMDDAFRLRHHGPIPGKPWAPAPFSTSPKPSCRLPTGLRLREQQLRVLRSCVRFSEFSLVSGWCHSRPVFSALIPSICPILHFEVTSVSLIESHPHDE